MGLPPFSPEFVTDYTPASLPLFLDPTVRHSALFPPLLDIISFNCLLGRVSTYGVGNVFTRCYSFEHPKNYDNANHNGKDNAYASAYHNHNHNDNDNDIIMVMVMLVIMLMIMLMIMIMLMLMLMLQYR
jgi:ABC-type Na+ efflux pump permease subunit